MVIGRRHGSAKGGGYGATRCPFRTPWLQMVFFGRKHGGQSDEETTQDKPASGHSRALSGEGDPVSPFGAKGDTENENPTRRSEISVLRWSPFSVAAHLLPRTKRQTGDFS